MRPRTHWIVLLTLTAVAPGRLAGQTSVPAWQPIAQEGVLRASALVDSVYIDRVLPAATVDGGDFASYLMARLGVGTLPPDFGYRVAVDTARLRIAGRIADLPPEARRALAQLLFVLPSNTRLEAQVTLVPAGPEAMRFHLEGASVQGVPIPETFLGPAMSQVGREYPALGERGRDLLVRIPAGGHMTLVPGGVRLTGPRPAR